MSDVHDYVSRYRHYSHRDLFSFVTPVDAGSVSLASSLWARVESDLTNLSQDLTRDMEQLMSTWQGSAGAEYADRIGTVTAFSVMLTQDAKAIGDGLDDLAIPMVNAIRDAQADNPANYEGHHHAIQLAATGALTGNPLIAAGAGLFGLKQDNDEADRAQQRMVQVVSTLAAAYDVTTQRTWPTSIASEPSGLPGTMTGAAVGAAVGAILAARAGTGTARGHVGAKVPGADPVGAAPTRTLAVGPSQISAPPELNNTADGGPLVAGAGAATLMGVTGATLGGLPSASRGPAAPGKSLGATFGERGVQGVLGKDQPTGDRPDDEAGARRGPDPRAGQSAPVEEEEARRSGLIGRGSADPDDAEDERLTWLTEDEMVWGQPRPAPPSTLA